MEDLSRAEYPAMLANLQPTQAVQALNDRVRRIAKINNEIADWLQERRKVEELYVAGLRKLLLFKAPNSASELGVFQAPWDKILQSTDSIAHSHNLLSQRIEKDVEASLRGFQGRKEMQNIHTISANLATMARELEDAQEKADKLTKKGGKANVQKVDMATAKLESSTQQWESQAPFIFETLQAVDELRLNHLRDVLTQLETHEVDQATRTQATAEEVLNNLLEVNTGTEIQLFSARVTAGRPKLEARRTGLSTRQSSIAGASTSQPPQPPPPLPQPPTSASGHDDDASETSGPREGGQSESRLRSRIGTMLGRRRQSIHGGFGQLSPQKERLGPFSRGLSSSHGRAISPRASSTNLAESSTPNNRLSALPESPTSPRTTDPTEPKEKPAHTGTNGITGGEALNEKDTPAPAGPSSSILNGTAEDIFDAPPPPGPPPSHQNKEAAAEPGKDADGFNIRPTLNDPISQAQHDAGGEEADQLFKLNIQKEPVAEEDPDAKQAALSNVTNALQLGMPSRRTGTIRGRRDVRNTIYAPAGLAVTDSPTENLGAFPPSPSLPNISSRPSAVSALASESSIGGTSDTQSVRSGVSLGSLTHMRHPDSHAPGLHTSIIEAVSATFDGSVIKSAKVNGEIAFSYNPDPSGSSPDHETIRINNFPTLAAIGPNRIFVNNVATSPDEFIVDLSQLSAKASPAFTYRVHAEDEAEAEAGGAPPALAPHAPLVIRAAWKPTGDKLGLLLQYAANPESKLARPIKLNNVVVVAHYEGARASGAQTKPTGTHLKDKHLVYWRLGDVTLSDGTSAAEWPKIVCRIVGEQTAEPKPGLIEVKWEYTPPAAVAVGEGADAGAAASEPVGSGISVSRLIDAKGKAKAADGDDEEEDPFADSDDKGAAAALSPKDARTWSEVPVVRRLVSGKYEAKA